MVLNAKYDYNHGLGTKIGFKSKSQKNIGYKVLSFLKKKCLINGKHGQGTHSTKMSVDKLAENALSDPNIFLAKLPA